MVFGIYETVAVYGDHLFYRITKIKAFLGEKMNNN